MSGGRERKLKRMLDKVPEGALVDSRWMRRHEIADSLYHDYVQRGWLVRLAHGLFLRPIGGAEPQGSLDWQVVVASMHEVMAIDFHVGGMTALELHGHGHYLAPGGKQRVELCAENLPGWLGKIETNAVFHKRSRKLLADPRLGVESLKSSGFSFAGQPSFPVSTPERAVLEAIDRLPEGAGFDQLDLVFQGLANLSPRRLMRLLRECRKIKVLRLFFVLADRHRHPWLAHLDKDALDFGRGDRQLVRGGRIHPIYRITVPASFLPSEDQVADA
jgi:hypothetical protein